MGRRLRVSNLKYYVWSMVVYITERKGIKINTDDRNTIADFFQKNRHWNASNIRILINLFASHYRIRAIVEDPFFTIVSFGYSSVLQHIIEDGAFPTSCFLDFRTPDQHMESTRLYL